MANAASIAEGPFALLSSGSSKSSYLAPSTTLQRATRTPGCQIHRASSRGCLSSDIIATGRHASDTTRHTAHATRHTPHGTHHKDRPSLNIEAEDAPQRYICNPREEIGSKMNFNKQKNEILACTSLSYALLLRTLHTWYCTARLRQSRSSDALAYRTTFSHGRHRLPPSVSGPYPRLCAGSFDALMRERRHYTPRPPVPKR